MKRKWNIVNNNSNTNYEVGNEIMYNTVLKSNLCNYNNGYILVIGNITVTTAPTTQVAFKNCAPFTKCVTKIDGTTIDYAEDLDLVMPMYNLIEYNSNYSKAIQTFRFYSKDGATNFNKNIENTDDFASFKYQDKLFENTEAQPKPNNANGILKIETIAVPLKYLSNFWRSLEMP